ncbi:MAG: hypothetical protein L0Y76_12655 [Ignavibacteria bacterium]|nr:hypothetical protein [Ignavibacteria bacterium]
MQTSQLDGFFRISYLKFPRILFLIPGRKYDLLLNIDERTSIELRDSSWVVFEDIWYGIKSCVDKAIKDKPPIIMEEFQYALISESEINIDLTTIMCTNPSLYFRNDIDSCNIKEKCYAVYDSIIQKCFIKKY